HGTLVGQSRAETVAGHRHGWPGPCELPALRLACSRRCALHVGRANPVDSLRGVLHGTVLRHGRGTVSDRTALYRALARLQPVVGAVWWHRTVNSNAFNRVDRQQPRPESVLESLRRDLTRCRADASQRITTGGHRACALPKVTENHLCRAAETSSLKDAMPQR